MSVSEHDLHEMMAEVYRLPSGPARSAAFDTVMRHADAAEATEIAGRSERDLLWKFKWIVWELPQFPAVPLDRTVAVLDDMERRFRQGNHSPHAVYQHRGLVAHHLGDLDAADHWYDRMIDASFSTPPRCPRRCRGRRSWRRSPTTSTAWT